MENNYIEILIQSLEKKKKTLDCIVELNKEQKILLQDPNLDPDDFEQNMKRKGKQIDELEVLDDGFEQLYERVRGELKDNREQHKEQIRRMQELIREISAQSASIQAQEARNKELIEQKFSGVRKQVREVRNSQKVVKQYYDNMMKARTADPRYVDNKK